MREMSDSELEDQFVRLSLMDASGSFAQIVFTDVKNAYSSNEDLNCVYTVMPGSPAADGGEGKVGLFKVGFCNVDECITTVDVGQTEDTGSVVFKAGDLPKDDVDYYQFCYVTPEGEIQGMSTPFTFTNFGEDICVEDIENDLLLIQTRTTMLQKKLEKTVTEINGISLEKNQLIKEVDLLRNQNQQYDEDLKAKDSLLDEIREHSSNREKQSLEEIQSLKAKMSENEYFISGMRVALSTLGKEKEDLVKQLDNIASEKELYKENTTEMQKRLREMIVNEASLNLEIMAKNSTATQLRNEIKVLEKSLAETLAKLKSSEEKVALQQSHCQMLTLRLNDSDSMLSAMATSKALATKELEAQIQNNKTLAANKSRLGEEMANTKTVLLDKEKGMAALVEDNERLKNENVALNETNIMLKNEMEEIKKERDQLKEDVAELQQRISLGAEEYRKKYIDWYKAQKKVVKLQDYIKDTSIISSDTENTPSTVNVAEVDHPNRTHNNVQSVKPADNQKLNKERNSKIRAEMENQLQMFQTSNLSLNVQSPSMVMMSGTESVVPAATWPNMDGERQAEYEELQSNSSNDSQFFDLHEQMHSTDLNWDVVEPHVPAVDDQFFEAVVPPEEPEPLWLKCPICEEYFTSSLDINEHIDSHLYYKCPVCNQLYDQELGFYFFQHHVNSHMN